MFFNYLNIIIKLPSGRVSSRKIKTHLETEDADMCMNGKQCVGLGIQVAQFRD